MSEAYIGQIEIFAFGFPPKNWALCIGSLLGINQNQALFSVLGTTYGGNGVSTFGLPDMRGRAPVSFSQNGSFALGQRAGEEAHTLTIAEMPTHNHLVAVDGKTVTTSNKNIPAPNTILGVTGGQTPDGKALQINLYNPAS